MKCKNENFEMPHLDRNLEGNGRSLFLYSYFLFLLLLVFQKYITIDFLKKSLSNYPILAACSPGKGQAEKIENDGMANFEFSEDPVEI